MGVSKARKHGKYLGGRAWPRVCQACRHCGGGPPELFYNARGLDNVCHKLIRQQGKDALEAWEPLPPEADDRSLERLEKDPGRWLQKYMSRSYAQPYIEQGQEAVRAEAMKVFNSIVDRWYGREGASPIQYLPAPRIEELAWASMAPVSPEGPAKLFPVEEDSLDFELAVGAPDEWVGYGYRQVGPSRLAPPATVTDGEGRSLVWYRQDLDIAVVLQGATTSVVLELQLLVGDEVDLFEFEDTTLMHLLQHLAQ